MIAVEHIDKSTIRRHYQLGTLFYRLLWGPHIHHGLWLDDEPASVAQCNLTDALADLAKIDAQDRVADIGCGMGGSAIRLAQHRNCAVTGVTISPVQRAWAAVSARLNRCHQRTQFVTADAEQVRFGPSSFDVVWSVECTEHLFDKPAFFRRAADWLRPGGRLAICVWFEGPDTSRPGHREQVEEVCRRFSCPSLATRDDYAQWIADAGLELVHNLDWTRRAEKTWEICKQRVDRCRVRAIAHVVDRSQVAFIDGFGTLLEAYRSGAMQYGAMVAEKPYG